MQVESGHLADVDWDGGTLYIQFRDGAQYAYFDVPNGIYMELLASESKSTYFRENIKGSFEYQRVR